MLDSFERKLNLVPKVMFKSSLDGSGSKAATQNGTLVNGNTCVTLALFILSHTQIENPGISSGEDSPLRVI